MNRSRTRGPAASLSAVLVTIAAAAAAAAMLAWGAGGGCDRSSSQGQGGAKDPKAVKIAVIPKGTTHLFWQSVQAGARKAGKELGLPDENIVWQGTTSEASSDQQINLVESVHPNVDAVVLAPVSYTALDRTIEEVAKQKPVVIFDSGCKTQVYTAFVATDNREGGRIAGRKMLELLAEEMKSASAAQPVKIAVVRTMAGSESTTQREEGFREVVDKEPRVKVVFEDYGESDPNVSHDKANAAIQAFPDLKAFYGPNESSTQGILRALKEKSLAGKVKFVGFDANPELVEGLRKGHVHALVLQDPVRMGYLGVKAAHAALMKQPVDKSQPIKPTLVTPENLDADPEVKALVASQVQ